MLAECRSSGNLTTYWVIQLEGKCANKRNFLLNATIESKSGTAGLKTLNINLERNCVGASDHDKMRDNPVGLNEIQF